MIAVALIVLVIAAVVGVVLWLQTQRQGILPKPEVYFARKALFTPAERSFLGVLEASLPIGFRVFGKIRLEDVIGVRAGLSRAERTAARNRINRKHVDFLLVRADDLSPVAGIELDDASHDAEERQDRDAFVDSAFASARLPLLHIPAQRSYNPSEIRAKISALLKP